VKRTHSEGGSRMLQKTNPDYGKIGNLDFRTDETAKMRIDIFTSKHCSFCNEALETVRSAVGNASYLKHPINVVETSVDNSPELIEAFNLVALPLIQIGRSQIIGLPNLEDVERLIHNTILMG
jgi:hypothetical protein